MDDQKGDNIWSTHKNYFITSLGDFITAIITESFSILKFGSFYFRRVLFYLTVYLH